MKKISLILAAFALVLGISQCRKQETPMGKLVTQDVTFTSSFNNGAKVSVDNTDPAALKLKWEAGDIIKVTDDATPANVSTLTCTEVTDDGKSGTFTGTITCQESANLTFSYNPIDYLNQDGSLQIYLEGTSPYQESGIYELEMKMPCAVLKLNVSALGTSGPLTIAAGRGTVASVTDVSEIASSVFVAVLANGESTEYTISCGNKIAKETWPALVANTFYTKDDGSGDGTGDAIVLEPYSGPELLPGKFSVSATEYVQFSRGNLLATRSSSSSNDWKLGFFENQYDYGTYSTGNVFTVNDTEMSLFTFGFTSFDPVGQAIGSEDYGAEYCRQNSLLEGTWCTLTGGNGGEWWYLLDGRPNAADLKVFKTVHGISNCLIILPDGFNTSDIPTTTALTDVEWADLEAKGAVCLPQAGYRVTSTYGTDSNGYWASNSYGTSNAYGAFFSGASVNSWGGGSSSCGYSIRLVRKFEWPEVEVTFVDLGLPSGTLWADVNVGATAKTGIRSYGKYYSWGETAAYLEPMTDYGSWTGTGNANYIEGNIKEHCSNTYWKWNGTSKYNSTMLMTDEDDIASQKYGAGSHIPTATQWTELFNSAYTTWTWDATNFGHIVTSKSDPTKSIFIPNASYYKDQTLDGSEQGRYWSKDYGTEGGLGTNNVYINKNNGGKSTSSLQTRGYGMTIRAVKPRPVPAGFVDLGLSVFWAESNLDGYYQFGATTQATGTSWGTTPYYVSGNENDGVVFSKYNTVGLTLDASDDAAAVAGKGRIPSVAEWDELRTSCTWTWNGSGFTVSRNGVSIILPAANSYGTSYGRGYYWANEVGKTHNFDAHYLYFGNNEQPSSVSDKWGQRYNAYCIRPVHD